MEGGGWERERGMEGGGGEGGREVSFGILCKVETGVILESWRVLFELIQYFIDFRNRLNILNYWNSFNIL